jgi:NAD(P)-dependent dehydrogenase (short-subunit alcohol dehydrogenase family)
MAAEEGAVRRRVGAVLALHADASVPQQVQRRPQRRAVLAVLRLAERRERTGATSSTSLFNVTRGRIINISSVNVQKGQFGQTNYATAKTGIHGFTMSLAQEVATKGITVNTASPGYIGTDMSAFRFAVSEKPRRSPQLFPG